MQRYHGPSVTSAVNNNSIGGTPIRDTVSADSSSVSTNFQLSSRRSSQITPYKLKCDNDPLNTRLGPPDYHPQNPNCPEETLTREYVQSGFWIQRYGGGAGGGTGDFTISSLDLYEARYYKV
ncbi:unnamed protein product [Rhodiola kirilowii]